MFRLAPAQTVQPVHAQTPGLDFQVVGQAHRPVELAAEPGDRLQPRLGRDLKPIEDRRQRQRDHSTGPASQLTTRPVQQRQIALQRHRQEPAVAGSTSTPRTKLSSRGGGKVTATKSGETPRLSTWKTIPPGECRLGRDIHGFLPRHPSFVNLVAVTSHLCPLLYGVCSQGLGGLAS